MFILPHLPRNTQDQFFSEQNIVAFCILLGFFWVAPTVFATLGHYV